MTHLLTGHRKCTCPLWCVSPLTPKSAHIILGQVQDVKYALQFNALLEGLFFHTGLVTNSNHNCLVVAVTSCQLEMSFLAEVRCCVLFCSQDIMVLAFGLEMVKQTQSRSIRVLLPLPFPVTIYFCWHIYFY